VDELSGKRISRQGAKPQRIERIRKPGDQEDEPMEDVESRKSESNKFLLPFLVIAFLFYVGSYYLLVRKQEKPVVAIWDLSSSQGSNPEYLWDTSFLHTAFIPIHWTDRRIRSEYWGPEGVIWEEADLSQFELH
jgi:hypothetical protein